MNIIFFVEFSYQLKHIIEGSILIYNFFYKTMQYQNIHKDTYNKEN